MKSQAVLEFFRKAPATGHLLNFEDVFFSMGLMPAFLNNTVRKKKNITYQKIVEQCCCYLGILAFVGAFY
jgi:hypothetical protein